MKTKIVYAVVSDEKDFASYYRVGRGVELSDYPPSHLFALQHHRPLYPQDKWQQVILFSLTPITTDHRQFDCRELGLQLLKPTNSC